METSEKPTMAARKNLLLDQMRNSSRRMPEVGYEGFIASSGGFPL